MRVANSLFVTHVSPMHSSVAHPRSKSAEYHNTSEGLTVVP